MVTREDVQGRHRSKWAWRGKVLVSRRLFLQLLLSSHPPAEESAPNHSCQSPSPASQDGEEDKEGALFPERTVPTRNAKVRAGKEDGIGPWTR